jgi:sucrose-6-phosphate hydrolase SacC (GH32 family)
MRTLPKEIRTRTKALQQTLTSVEEALQSGTTTATETAIRQQQQQSAAAGNSKVCKCNTVHTQHYTTCVSVIVHGGPQCGHLCT